MKNIRSLIKMQKLLVDDQRRVLAERQKEADAITMEIATLQASMETEKLLAAENEDHRISFGAFVKAALQRHDRLQRALSAKEREIGVEHNKLSLLFEELKRYEIAQEHWDEEQREEEQRRENMTYDEQAGQRHHRDKE